MNLLFTVIGGKFKFQVQDSDLEWFFLEIWRFEKNIALSEKKATYSFLVHKIIMEIGELSITKPK